MKDLHEIQKVTNAKAFFSAYVSARDKEELEELFSYYRELFPTTPFFITGLQIKEHNPVLPKGFTVIPSVEKFTNALDEFGDGK